MGSETKLINNETPVKKQEIILNQKPDEVKINVQVMKRSEVSNKDDEGLYSSEEEKDVEINRNFEEIKEKLRSGLKRPKFEELVPPKYESSDDSFEKEPSKDVETPIREVIDRKIPSPNFMETPKEERISDNDKIPRDEDIEEVSVADEKDFKVEKK